MSQQTVICPNCKTENRADAKFCRQCRAPLGAEQVPPASSTVPLQGRATTRRLQAQPPADLPSPAVTPQGARGADVTPLTIPSLFQDLPEGAIFNSRYEALSMIGQPEPSINVYQVREIATGKSWTLFESADARRFDREGQFAKLGLNHEGLVKVKEAFEWVPYAEQHRGYLVSEYPQVPLDQTPQITDYQLAVWGGQFAEALAFLHSQKICLGGVTLSNLTTVNGRAKLTDLSAARPLTEGSSQEAATSLDIHELVSVLSLLANQVRQGVPLAPPLLQILQREPASSNRYPTAKDLQVDFEQAAEMIRNAAKVRLVFDRGWDTGQKREINEDAVWVQELTSFSNAFGKPVGLFLVADGLGGAAAGEVASQLAVETVAREVTAALSAHPPADGSEMDWGAALKRAVENANRVINANRQQVHNDMGTTLVGALVVGYQAFVVNVGDSRAYLVTRDRPIERISHDHSLVQSLVDSHQIREEDVRTHPQRNLVFRTLGDRSNVEVDLFTKTLELGQWLVFCSDGLWEMVQDSDIQRIVTSSPTPKQACDTLVELANNNGGDDNITVVVVQIDAG